MPTKCSVNGCDNYYSKGVPFFDVPSPLKYKFCSEKAEWSKKRRKRWLDLMGISDDSGETLRICSKHFVTGKPASLEDYKHVDWIPTVCMDINSRRSRHRNRDTEQDEKRRSSSSQHRHSIKENIVTRRRNKSEQRQTRSQSEVKGKIKKCHFDENQFENYREDGLKKLRPDAVPTQFPTHTLIKEEETRTQKKASEKKLNCKVVLDGNIQCATFKGTNGSGLTIAQKYGKFTCDNVTLKEAALNNNVLRIHLVKEDLHDLKRNYESLNSWLSEDQDAESVSRFSRRIKLRNSMIDGVRDHSRANKTFDDTPDSDSAEDTRKPMKDEKGIRNTSIHAKLQLGKSHSVDSKTLNRAIKKSYRDKIKIRLFPKSLNNKARKDKSDLRNDTLFENFESEQQWQTFDSSYYLKFHPYNSYPEDGKLDYPFQKLVTDVKHMKLPAPNWKIKVIIRQGKISAITFTNKMPVERYVAFSVRSDTYKVVIDNKAALLVGAPRQIQSSEDLEILLDVIENLDSKDPMILYK